MISPHASPSPRHDLPHRFSAPPGDVALILAGLALALMPLAMWLANRSAPLCLAISALACLVMLWRQGWPLADRLRLLRALRAPLALPLALLVAFAALSIVWSHRPLASLFALGELLVPLLSGVIVALVLPPRAPRWLGWALAVSVLAAVTLAFIELHMGTGFRQKAGLQTMTFIFNRSLICAMLAAIPLAGWLVAQKRPAMELGLMFVLALTVATSESGAARLGLVVALAAMIASAMAPRLALIAASIGLVALVSFAPVQGEIAERLIPASTHQQLQDSHSRDRVEIWLSFGEAIRAQPLLGAGFGTSPTLDKHPVASAVSVERRAMLAVGHPHSAPMQAWVETGIIGAACLAFAGLALLWRLRTLPARDLAPRLALFAMAFAVASVAHGAWQGWWIAALAVGAVWLWTGLGRDDQANRGLS